MTVEQSKFSCKACGYSLEVTDSRPTKVNGLQAVRRRRRCKSCNSRITTYEFEAFEDIEDIKFSLGRILVLARMAHSGLGNLIDQYDKMVGKDEQS